MPTQTPTEFAVVLRRHLDDRGLTIRAFARILDPDEPERARRNLTRYLSGTKPGRVMRIQIADALSSDREEFLAADADDEDD